MLRHSMLGVGKEWTPRETRLSRGHLSFFIMLLLRFSLLLGRPPHLSLRSTRSLLREKVIDLGSGDMIQDYAAHEKAVWSLDLRPDGKGLVTGSADRSVSFCLFP